MPTVDRLRASGRLVHEPADLTFGGALSPLADELATGRLTWSDLTARVQSATGQQLGGLLSDSRFADDEQRVADSLVAVKLASGAPDVDAVALVRLRQLFDALHRAAQGSAPTTGTVSRRTLALPE